jgi:hypothetical protein
MWRSVHRRREVWVVAVVLLHIGGESGYEKKFRAFILLLENGLHNPRTIVIGHLFALETIVKKKKIVFVMV